MKKFFSLYLLCLVVLLNSCRSFKNLTAKDVSASERSKKESDLNKVLFLDNVSVTPGSKRIINAEVSHSKKNYNSANKNVDIENASQLQLKYAILLNVSVEELGNPLLLQAIDHWWGTKFCLGGSTEDCVDCSGLTQILMRDVYAIDIPRTAREQYNSSTHIKREDLQQGDLVFFQNSRHDITHVGMYIASDKFIHATVSNGVMISDMNDNYWKQRYKGAGTPFK